MDGFAQMADRALGQIVAKKPKRPGGGDEKHGQPMENLCGRTVTRLRAGGFHARLH
jgi:hypothetical protein